jgi:hypothetical protein
MTYFDYTKKDDFFNPDFVKKVKISINKNPLPEVDL